MGSAIAITWPIYDASNTNSNITLNTVDSTATMTTSGSSAQGLAYLPNTYATGKMEVEFTVTFSGSASGYFEGCGITLGGRASLGTWSPGNISTGYAYACDAGVGNKVHNGSETGYGVAIASGDVLMMAVDITNGFIYFGKNGTWMNSGVPTSGASGTGSAYSFTALSTVYFAAALGNYSAGTNCSMNLNSVSKYLPSGYTYYH